MSKEIKGRLLNITLFCIIFLLIFFIKERLLQVLGGSAALILVLSVNTCLYLNLKKYYCELGLFNSIIFLLIIINIIPYYESKGSFKEGFILNINFTILTLIIIFFMLFVKNIAVLHPENILAKKNKLSSKMITIVAFSITSSLIFFLMLSSCVTTYNIPGIALYSLTISLLIMFSFLLLFEKNFQKYSIFDKTKNNSLNKKLVFLLFLVVLIVWTVFESERGNWLAWTGSISVLFFLMIITYKLLNYNIANTNNSLNEIDTYADKI